MKTNNTPSSPPLPPGSLGLPLIGETLSFLQEPQFAEKRQQKYGSVFKTHLFGRPTIFLIGAEANCFLLSHENQYFLTNWPRSTKTLLGPAALSVQTGVEHQRRRKLLSQAFQPRALAGYISTMEQSASQYLQKWEQLGTLTWYPELRNYTLDIACKLIVGIESGSQTQLGQWFNTWCDGLFAIPLSLPWTKFGQALRCRKLLLSEIEKIVRQRQQQTPSQDTLGLLLQAEDEEGERLSLNELKDQLLTLLFAGHETLTSALASFCRLLAQHPVVLAKARAEQQQLALDNGSLTLEHLKQMSYLEQVLKEVLRVVPPVGGGFREVIKACEFNGFLIPQGWSILYQISRTHQDGSVYYQPENFDPERFGTERAEDKLKSFSYVPFGGGIRECLGKEFARLEMKVFAALLLRNYEWELLPKQNLELIMVPTPHPKDGLQVSFRRR